MEEMIQRQIRDLCQRMHDKNRWVASFFLDPMQQMLAIETAKKEQAAFVLWGGYPDAERKMIFIVPAYMDETMIQKLDEIVPLGVNVSGDGLTHRDYLGAILGLGIERRCLGDILCTGRKALFFVEKKMAAYLESNLIQIGRMNASVDRATANDWREYEREPEELLCNVASLRLDAVTSAIFQTSRAKVQEWIQMGFVSKNWEPCLDASKAIQEGDTISVRKKGRAQIVAMEGKSKKGRLFLRVACYRRR